MHLEKSDSKNLLIWLGIVIETLKEKLPDQKTNQSLWPIQRMLNALEDLVERIDNLSAFTTYKTSQKLNRKIKYAQFVVPSYINWTLFKDNLQLNSNIFRYALRMAVALPVGYELGQLLEVGHSYWIVLTILVILKPAYALTRQRNLDRLLGTFAGGLVGIFILLFIKSNLLLTIILIGCMVGAFSLIRIRYSLSVALITIYVLVSFYLLSPGDYTPVVKDRLIDTFIGSIISLIFTRLIPPIWEKEQMNELLAKAILSSKEYFNQIILALRKEETNISTFRWHRKENYIAIANLSDAFQRMLNEPKNRQNHGDYLYQLVVSCHVLASRNAYLSSMIIKLNHTDPVFIQESLVVKTKNQLADAARMLSNPDDSEIKNNLGEIRLNEPEMAIKGISEFSDNQQNEMNSVLISIRHLSKEIKSLCQNFIEN